MYRRILPFLFLLAFSNSVYAISFEIAFNDSSAQLNAEFPLAEKTYGKTLLNGRFLHNDREETTLGSLGIDFTGEPGNVPGLLLGLGVKGYGGEADDDRDILAMGVGGMATFYPPSLGGFGLSGKVVYAPDIFTGEDADRILELSLTLGYALTPQIKLTGGYQNIRTDWEDGKKWTIDDAFRVGFQATF